MSEGLAGELNLIFLKEQRRLRDRRNIHFSALSCTSFDEFDQVFRSRLKLEDMVKLREVSSQLTSEAISVVAEWLNKVHQRQYSVKFWQTVLEPFFSWYCETVVLRIAHLEDLCQSHANIRISVLDDSKYQPIRNTLDFVSKSISNDAWNLQLISQLIKIGFFSGCHIEAYRPKEFRSSLPVVNSAAGTGQKVSDFSKRIINKFLSIIGEILPRSQIVLLAFYMPLSWRIALLLKSKGKVSQMVPFGRGVVLNAPLNKTLRSSLLDGRNAEKTQLFAILSTLVFNLPTQFLEHFGELEKVALAYSKDCKTKVFVSDQGFAFTEHFKGWVAYMKEKGSISVSVQHGGGYGDRLFASSEAIERRVHDAFFSWGWSDGDDVYPLPTAVLASRASARTKFQNERLKRKSARILFSSTSIQALECTIDLPCLMSSFGKAYLDDQIKFIETLDNEKLLNALVLRLYHVDYGVGQKAILMNKFPFLGFDSYYGSKGFYRSLGKSCLFVTDNLNTTFLHALYCNIPSILYLNRSLWPSREVALSFYNRLEEVGIFHESPESAANWLQNVWGRLNDWWFSPKTQDARKQFLSFFAHSSDTAICDWLESIEHLAERANVEKFGVIDS